MKLRNILVTTFTINAARLLETITEKNELIDITLLKQSISDEVIERINTLVSDVSSTTE